MKSLRANPTAAAMNVRRFRDRLRERGLIKKDVWILPEHGARLAELEKAMREPGWSDATASSAAAAHAEVWTLPALEAALAASPFVQAGQVAIERLEGAEPSLRLTMRAHGGLAVLLAVSGEQILVETYLWPVSAVRDPDAFNACVLQTHKYLPLSTFSLADVAGEPSYTMFGSLGTSSSLASVWLEIQALAENVVAAVDLYADHLQGLPEESR